MGKLVFEKNDFPFRDNFHVFYDNTILNGDQIYNPKTDTWVDTDIAYVCNIFMFNKNHNLIKAPGLRLKQVLGIVWIVSYYQWNIVFLKLNDRFYHFEDHARMQEVIDNYDKIGFVTRDGSAWIREENNYIPSKLIIQVKSARNI
jgi:hypothetical protein